MVKPIWLSRYVSLSPMIFAVSMALSLSLCRCFYLSLPLSLSLSPRLSLLPLSLCLSVFPSVCVSPSVSVSLGLCLSFCPFDVCTPNDSSPLCACETARNSPETQNEGVLNTGESVGPSRSSNYA